MKSNLYSFALMLTSSTEQAGELVALTRNEIDAMVADGQLDKVDFRSYAFSLMRNIFMSRYGHSNKATAERMPAIKISFALESSMESVEGLYEVEQLTRSIESMDSEHSMMMSLHATGYTRREIARHMNVPMRRVHTRIKAAVRALSRC